MHILYYLHVIYAIAIAIAIRVVGYNYDYEVTNTPLDTKR
jgi:hypothetical protein